MRMVCNLLRERRMGEAVPGGGVEKERIGTGALPLNRYATLAPRQPEEAFHVEGTDTTWWPNPTTVPPRAGSVILPLPP